MADQEFKQETKAAQPSKPKKKAFDLFAESSDSEEDDDALDEEAAGNKEGFTVANPSVDDEGYYQPKTGEMI